MYVSDSIDEVKSVRKGLHGTVALVPTMGNLHEGHMALVKHAKEIADQVIVTIFVNPMQFGPNEDLDNYPRTLEKDLKLLEHEGVALAFIPTNNAIYPQGIKVHTQVTVPEITANYCGANRPGHFTGVSTVVLKLFNITQPDIAVFGKKDYQQLAVIRKMVADFCLPINIVGVETVREDNGLARSSRNQYLSDDEHALAAELYKSLTPVKSESLAGNQNFQQLEFSAITALNNAGFAMDYFTIAKQRSLSPAQNHTTDIVILAAGKLGSTRLIDNLEFIRPII